MNSPADIARVRECLEYMRNNPSKITTGWRLSVEDEARQLGLLPPLKPSVGRYCRPGIDRGIAYGGDMEDVL